MTHHAAGWAHPHTPLPIELPIATAVLLEALVTAVLTAHPDTRLDRPTRNAISELREQLHKSGRHH